MTDRDETISGSLERADKSGSLPDGLYVVLEVLEGPDQGMKFELENASTTIGRKEADIKLGDPTVSGKHATIEYVGGKLFITDNKSTNGTRLNGNKVESSPISNLDEIKGGDTRLLLSVLEDKYGARPGVSEAEDADESRVEVDESTMVSGPLPNPEIPSNIQVVLEVVEGEDKSKKFRAAYRSTVIGRGQKADLRLSDTKVSKRHCQIEVHNKDKMTVKDLASSNGTRVNQRYISAVKIRHGDMVHIGDTKIRLLIHVRQ